MRSRLDSRLATLLIFAAIGEYLSKKAGVLKMSFEGMMLTGAFAAAVGSWAFDSPVLGLVIGVLAVLPVVALQAFLTCKLRANQIVNGIWINILILDSTTLGYRSSETIPGFAKWPPAFVGELPVLGEALFRQVWLAYFSFSLSSPFGLSWREPELASPYAPLVTCPWLRQIPGFQSSEFATPSSSLQESWLQWAVAFCPSPTSVPVRKA